LQADLQQLAVNFRRKISGYAESALLVVHDGHAVAVRSAESPAAGPCSSSLLVGSLPAPASAQLLIRASTAGALAPLARELLALAGQSAARRPLVDLHLYPPDGTADSDVIALECAAASAVNQAVGALLDRGWLPEEAVEELDRLGEEIAVPAGVAARLFLRGLVNRGQTKALKTS
jgi:hypothetical protein